LYFIQGPSDDGCVAPTSSSPQEARMNARDIMTTPVVSICRDTRLARIAALLAEHRISGLPVVDRGVVAGIVSERDLLDHREIGPASRRAKAPWWACMFPEAPDPARYVRSHGVRAEDVMSAPAISVGQDATAARIQALLEKRRIRRVPVLDRGRLVGIVTRADLVRALPLAAQEAQLRAWQSDDTIRSRLLEELEGRPWWRAPSVVEVTHGVVRLSGICDGEEARRAARVAAENIPGVRAVEDNRVPGADISIT
jgi:CBS domain-containing protein